MGKKAWARFAELRKVAHAYILYGITALIIHGLVHFAINLNHLTLPEIKDFNALGDK